MSCNLIECIVYLFLLQITIEEIENRESSMKDDVGHVGEVLKRVKEYLDRV